MLQFAPGLSRSSTKPDNYGGGQDGLGDGYGPILPGGRLNFFSAGSAFAEPF